jgi:PAS domain S-box-containing protein
MFGFSAAEAIGQSLDIIIPERLREAHWRGFHAAIASGRTRLNGRPTVTRALHKSGATLYVEMSFAMVCATSGEVIGSVAVARDATGACSARRPPGALGRDSCAMFKT